MTQSPTPDCLILGGGLSGSMAAIRLSSAGRKTLLIEKEKSPHHKVCGEFLSPEAVTYLHHAGIDPAALGAAQIQILRLSVGDRVVETRLPFTALSLSRHILDEALLVRAAEQGCTVLRGAAIEKLCATRHETGQETGQKTGQVTGQKKDQAWTAHLATGQPVTAPAVFLATGKHDLRGWPRSPGVQSDLIGFKLHWRLLPPQTAALENAMELFLFRGGYGGLALVENQTANLCLVIRKPVLRKLGGWPALLTALLAENRRIRRFLGHAQPLWDRPLAVSSIPYGHLGSPFSSPTLWPLGDQVAVIPSFTGDGMSIALHSASLAARMHLSGGSPGDYQRKLVGQLGSGMKLATALSRASVHPLPRQAAPLALSLFPQAMSWIATSTRIPAIVLDPAPIQS